MHLYLFFEARRAQPWTACLFPGRNVFKPPNPPVNEQFKQISKLAGGRAIRTHPLVVKAGGVTFHNSRTVHGSMPNLATGQGRLSLVVHMIVDGTSFRGWDREGAGHSSNVLLRPECAGEPYAGPYFPVIWSAKDMEGETTHNCWVAPTFAATPRL